MKRTLADSIRSVLLVTLLTMPAWLKAAEEFPVDKTLSDDGFEVLFDGKTLDGWHVSAETGHSRVTKNMSGGKWVVEDGAITGSQDVPGNGGIVVTDREFGDFEVIVQMKNDYGPDSGLFLRSNNKGQAYQYLVDYHDKGSLAGIYGEGMGGKPHVRNFDFTGDVKNIVLHDCHFPCPIKVEQWPEFWKHGEWNELRARIVGNPPTLDTWINRVKFMHFEDTEKRRDDKGMIALQVHGGGDFTKQFVRYRGVKVKTISK